MQGTQRTHQRLVIVTARLTASLSTVVVAVVVIAVAFIVVDVLVLRLRLILAHIEALLVENVNHIQSIRLTHCSSLRLGFCYFGSKRFLFGSVEGQEEEEEEEEHYVVGRCHLSTEEHHAATCGYCGRRGAGAFQFLSFSITESSLISTTFHSALCALHSLAFIFVQSFRIRSLFSPFS